MFMSKVHKEASVHLVSDYQTLAFPRLTEILLPKRRLSNRLFEALLLPSRYLDQQRRRTRSHANQPLQNMDFQGDWTNKYAIIVSSSSSCAPFVIK